MMQKQPSQVTDRTNSNVGLQQPIAVSFLMKQTSQMESKTPEMTPLIAPTVFDIKRYCVKIVHLNGHSEEYEQNSGLVRGANQQRNSMQKPTSSGMSNLGGSIDPEVRIIDLINELEGRIRDKIKNYMVSYFSPKMKCYVYVGVLDSGLNTSEMDDKARMKNHLNKGGKKQVPEDKDSQSEDEVDENAPRSCITAQEKLSDLVQPDSKNIILKFREKAKSDSINSALAANESKGSRREKERKIGEVVIKVCEWRSLYRNRSLTLEDAAKSVSISKKSLDDYFFQLKKAQKNGFNFNEHKNDKIGILRSFNKRQNETQKKQRKGVQNQQ